MSDNITYIWDASITPELAKLDSLPENVSIPDDLPDHNTKAKNYNHFYKVTHDFLEKAWEHYPEMHYEGTWVLNNCIEMEASPYEIIGVFDDLITETAVHNNLCVYRSLFDEFITPTPEAKAKYPLGGALKAWQAQKQADAAHAAKIEEEARNNNIDIMELFLNAPSRDIDNFIKIAVKERLKQAGITKVTKPADDDFLVKFAQTQMRLGVAVGGVYDDGQIIPIFYGRIIIEPRLKIIPLSPNSPYETTGLFYSPIRIYYKKSYRIPQSEMEQMQPKITSAADFYHKMQQTIDIFVDAYSKVQTLKDLHIYSLNLDNDPRRQNAKVHGWIYEPIPPSFVLFTAYHSHPKAEYEQIKAAWIPKWLEWLHTEREIALTRFIETEKERKLNNPDYEIQDYRTSDWYLSDTPEVQMMEKINKKIKEIEYGKSLYEPTE